jgi:large subunit ribosomal protein L1
MAAPKKKDKKETAGNVVPKGNRSVRYAKATAGKDFLKPYALKEAIALVKSCVSAKFDESVDVSFNLGIDTKQTDQTVRGVISLPNGTGKKVTVAVFARDKKADEAKKAGAQIVGAEDLIEKVAKGEVNFDRCIATPDMMPLLGKVAKVLGPKGLMPNPKLGSVSDDVATAVKNALAGQVEYRAEKGGVVHAIVGKASFTEAALEENIKVLFDAVQKAKPSSSKGVYLKKITLSSTMGPSVKVVTSSISA